MTKLVETPKCRPDGLLAPTAPKVPTVAVTTHEFFIAGALVLKAFLEEQPTH
jgi:hypothetical protein